MVATTFNAWSTSCRTAICCLISYFCIILKCTSFFSLGKLSFFLILSHFNLYWKWTASILTQHGQMGLSFVIDDGWMGIGAVCIFAGVDSVGEPVLPVWDPSPQLWVLQHHPLVIIGNDNLLTSGPAGVQRGHLLRTVTYISSCV